MRNYVKFINAHFVNVRVNNNMEDYGFFCYLQIDGEN